MHCSFDIFKGLGISDITFTFNGRYKVEGRVTASAESQAVQ